MIDLLLALALQGSETVAVPGGKYDVPLVRVPAGGKLQAFWMAKTEIPGDAFMDYYQGREKAKVDGVTRPSAPYEPPMGDMGVAGFPAVGMRWHGAQGFCAWLSAKTGHKFRLPTEAEWEAAAAGTTADTAWHAENAGKKTHGLGTKPANKLGFHDLLGNVWEYALEPMTPGEYAPVLRGGAWNTPPAELAVDKRQGILPAWYDRDPNRPRSLWWLTDARFVGFRVVRVGEAAQQEAQKAYAAKIEVKNLKLGEPVKQMVPVTGEIVNLGDKVLWEVELTVHFLDGEGKPLTEDEKARPTYVQAYPVLVNAYHPGAHAAPLKPGASRTFTALVPQAYEVPADPEKAAAKVTGVRFAD
jgi:hypothetical protein